MHGASGLPTAQTASRRKRIRKRAYRSPLWPRSLYQLLETPRRPTGERALATGRIKTGLPQDSDAQGEGGQQGVHAGRVQGREGDGGGGGAEAR